MEKEFKYKSPRIIYDIESSDLVDITSLYRGLETIWIYVDATTRKNPQFVSDGELPKPDDHKQLTAIKLDAHNENHIILMDMLKNSTAHPHTEEVTIYLNELGDIPGAPEYQFSHTYSKYLKSVVTYDTENTYIDNENVVHYSYRGFNGGTWYDREVSINLLIGEITEKLKDPLVLEIPAAKVRYERYLAVITYMKENLMHKVHPWLVTTPAPSEV
jgi:hypothetical protein